jgi:hypothetical protein
MRRICGEATLNQKALLQPVERMIDGDDERERLGWHIGLGQAQRDRSGPDSARLPASTGGAWIAEAQGRAAQNQLICSILRLRFRAAAKV